MLQFDKGIQEDVSEADLENYLCSVSSTMHPKIPPILILSRYLILSTLMY